MDSKEITEKLLTMYSHRGDGLPTQYVNPDGPEAVTHIAAQDARIVALEGLLRSALNSRTLGTGGLKGVICTALRLEIEAALGDDHAE